MSQSAISTIKRDNKHTHQFHTGVPPPGQTFSIVCNFVCVKYKNFWGAKESTGAKQTRVGL